MNIGDNTINVLDKQYNKRAHSDLRATDENAAEIISKWLEQHFYISSRGISNYRYNHDLDAQYKGVDTEFDYNGKHYVCDEKAAVQYINKPLQTFAFELSFLDKGNNYHDGWLLDESKINNSFLCIWVDSADVYKPTDLKDMSQIRKVSVALLDKSRITDYIYSLGWSKDGLKMKSERLRNNVYENCGNIYQYGCKFVVSRQLVEQPINILIHRDRLMQLADFSCVIDATH